MISLLAQTFRLFKAVVVGLKDKDFQSLLFLTCLLVFSGVIFYWRVEGWKLLDAAYFCIATLTTVGYGDFTPQTDFGKVFTIVYMIGGIGLFLGFIDKIGYYGSLQKSKK